MKRLSLLLVLALGCMMALAQNGRIDLRSSSRAEITHSDFNSLRATFSYGSIESIEINTERGTFSEIAIEGTYASGEMGAPELPASHQLLAVPFGATPRVTVTNYTTTDYRLSDYGIGTILPHQPSVRKDQNLDEVEFVYNAAAYQTRSLATTPQATIEVQGTMRGIRIGSLVINPVSYNPASNTLRVFNNIEVEVSFDGADIAETERMLLSTYSPYFDIVYKQMFNYRQILDVYTDHPDLMAYPVHMIVITPENYISALQPWLDWKTQKGFYVNVVTTAQAGGNYNAIQSYVQNLYNTGVNQGATPTFLVLVGDTGQVPGRTNGTATQKVTDLYYGSVDGDYFPDMFYSRLSAENTSQLTAAINKILQYEQYTMPDPSYLNNVTLIAGWDSYWNARIGRPTINYATTYYYNTAHGFSQVNAYLQQGQYNGCYNTLNTGVGFVNYTAHGSETSWSDPYFSSSNVNALTNANKYFLAMGNCCLTGDFGTTCFGEAMLRGENKAAFSYIGSCPVTYWYEDYYFGVGATSVYGQTPSLTNTATGVYDGIWMDDTYNTVSSIVFLGNIAVCYASTGGYQTSSSPTYYWQAYHVLGDGSIMPYRVNPTPNNVTHASTFPAGATSFQVGAQEGSYVAISQNNVLKGVALVPASGTVNVPVASGITSGQVRIVVTKPQRQPYIQDINVGGTPPQTYTITVSANPTNGGQATGGGTFTQGESCTVVATANSGFTFVNWTENGQEVSTLRNYTFTVEGNRNLVANFQAQPQNYTISVTANPTNGGTVTGGGTYQEGQSCTVSATPATGYTFLRWTENGQQVSTNASYTFNVTGNRTLVAQFQIQSFNITATANPTAGGSVNGGGTYNYGASCTLTATPASGYTFLKWTKNGQQVSTNATYAFTVTESAAYVAHFEEQIQYYSINVSANPANAGTVSGGGTYAQGTSCTVTATPIQRYEFVNWTENGTEVSTNSTYTFTVISNRTLVANFRMPDVVITASVDPEEAAIVDGTGTFHYGDIVTLKLVRNEDWAFQNWTQDGEVMSEEMVYTFTATESCHLIAHFMYTEGVDEHNSHILLYPNPVSDKLTVETSEALSSVEVFNLMGTMVYSQKDCGSRLDINTANLPTGIYFIRLKGNTISETRRFVKE